MKKIGIVLPYFGKFNNYFDLWLKSCEHNASIDFIIFTNNLRPNRLAPNIHWHYISFNEMKKYIQDKFPFEISLEQPYKLCDYKGFYGFIFEEYLENYDFWGFCDCDLIFGNIRKFLTDELLSSNDKIYRTGHFSVVRNNSAVNRNFFNYDTYKVVLSSPLIYGYDESVFGFRDGMAGELLKSGFRFHDDQGEIADVDFRRLPFCEVNTNAHDMCIYLYENGSVYRISNNGIDKEEIMYVHFQKRKFDVIDENIDINKYVMEPNCFKEFQESKLHDSSYWSHVSTEDPDYYDLKKEQQEKKLNDIKRLLDEPNKIKAILYRLRRK